MLITTMVSIHQREISTGINQRLTKTVRYKGTIQTPSPNTKELSHPYFTITACLLPRTSNATKVGFIEGRDRTEQCRSLWNN